MKTSSFAIFAFAAALLTGCWTFNETPYPQTEVPALPAGTNVVLGVNGFAATVVEYSEFCEFRTIYVPGHYGRHHVRPGYYETVPVVTSLAQKRETDQYLRRAKDALERAGFTIGATTPDWTMEVAFEGPFVSRDDELCEFAWTFGSIFFCDYGAATWKAKLRVRDNRTGKLVFHRDYSQLYETNVVGLLPILSISAATETSPAFMQSWCLAALTDRVVADTAGFFASR